MTATKKKKAKKCDECSSAKYVKFYHYDEFHGRFLCKECKKKEDIEDEESLSPKKCIKLHS